MALRCRGIRVHIVQHRCLQVMDMNREFNGTIAEIPSLAIDHFSGAAESTAPDLSAFLRTTGIGSTRTVS